MNKPNVNSEGQKELEKVAKQLDAFDEQNKKLVGERNLMKNPNEEEPQTKLSQKELEAMGEVYLKPVKTISTRQKFNEKFRKKYEFSKEYVKFTAENKEIIGESIEMWTRPFGGMPAEFWRIPVNKPIMAPRYVAEQLKRKFYNRVVMEDKTHSQDGVGTYYGVLTVDKPIQRLDAIPVSNNKSIFMGV